MQAQQRMPVRYGQGGAGETSATPTAGSPRWEYAGFWRHFAACFIDAIILYILGLVVGFVMLIGFIPLEYEDPVQFGVALLFAWIVNVIMQWLYYAVFESSPTQATPGKMALGLVVTDLHGQRVSFGRATARHFAKLLSWLLLCTGYLMVGVTPKKQGLHDALAGTLVLARR